MIVDFIFYIFSFALIVGCLGVILTKNPVYSVLFLIFSFFNAAALFVLLKSEFLAMVLVIVYVGAVAVLFLFIVMLINIKSAERRQYFSKYMLVSFGVVILLSLEMYFFIKQGMINFIAESNQEIDFNVDISSVSQLGMVLFDNYYYVFLVSGLVLTVAMIGAVILASKENDVPNKRQNILQQNKRSKENSVYAVKVKNEEGIK